jgi:hypothetical protein
VKSCDLTAGAGKLELAIKSLRTTIAAVDKLWNDETHRQFQEMHLAPIEPSVRGMFDAIAKMAEAIAAAERDCGSE